MARPLPPIPPEDFCDDDRPQLKLVPTPDDVLNAWATKPRRRAGTAPWRMNKVLPEALAMIEAEETRGEAAWINARGHHFVALHAYCYERVYKTILSMSGDDRCNSGHVATRMLRVDFDGDGAAMIRYLRWAWVREEARERERRAGRRQAGPAMSWYSLFAARNILNDYRRELALEQEALEQKARESGIRVAAGR